MIVIRKDNQSENRVILSNVLYYEKKKLEIKFFYHNNYIVKWQFESDEEIQYCLNRIDEILNDYTFGSFRIIKNNVETIIDDNVEKTKMRDI